MFLDYHILPTGTAGEPDAGGIIGNKSPWSSNSRSDQMPAQMPVKDGRGDQHSLGNEDGYGCEQGREDGQRETLSHLLRDARDSVDHGPTTTKISDGAFGRCTSNSRHADQDPKARHSALCSFRGMYYHDACRSASQKRRSNACTSCFRLCQNISHECVCDRLRVPRT